jgi:5'-deoxynucleotidase YfbR-like HD superfamily hydrolase
MVTDCTSAGVEVEALWREYEEGSSKEAQLVKDFDKVDLPDVSA